MSSQIGTPSLHAAQVHRPRHRPRREDALLIEHAVIGQIDLEAHGLDAAPIEQRHGVVDAVRPPREPMSTRPIVCVSRASASQRRARRLLESGLQHQILGRIAGEKKLGEGDQVGARRGGARARLRAPLALPSRSPTTGLSCASASLNELI